MAWLTVLSTWARCVYYKQRIHMLRCVWSPATGIFKSSAGLTVPSKLLAWLASITYRGWIQTACRQTNGELPGKGYATLGLFATGITVVTTRGPGQPMP